MVVRSAAASAVRPLPLLHRGAVVALPLPLLLSALRNSLRSAMF